MKAISMSLNELLARAQGLADQSTLGALTLIGDGGTMLGSIAYDSHGETDGALFCCIEGSRFDGHDFALEAVRAGAAALLVNRDMAIDVPQIKVVDVRKAMATLSAVFYGHPSKSLQVIGITGTNGKTTTAHLIAAVLHQHGWATEVFGTISSARTTPESPDLQRMLAEQVSAGKQAVVMEVSSHALAQDRVLGTRFCAAVFTNLSREHLDFHGTTERYFAAKASLFTAELTDVAIINRDDVHGRLLLDTVSIECQSYGASDVSNLQFDATKHSYDWNDQKIEVAIGGSFNFMNSLAAATAAAKLGVAPYDIAKGLAAAGSVAGRFEAVNAGQLFAVIVDYAHTPDAIQNVLDSARLVANGAQVIVVFGCGGDRDQDKRPEMGRIAASFADVVVVTSDNPRSENQRDITAQICAGIDPATTRGHVLIEHDRRAAIARAFAYARAGDVVVIAGKGHETTQLTGDQITLFSDVAVARELLEAIS